MSFAFVRSLPCFQLLCHASQWVGTHDSSLSATIGPAVGEALQLSLRIFTRVWARLPFSRSEGEARDQRRMGVLEGAIAVDRLNDDDHKASTWRKLQPLETSYLLEVYPEFLSFKPPGSIKMQTKGGPSFWCSTLIVLGFLSCLRVVEASSASPPGSSSAHSTLFYVGIAATIIGPIIAAISLGVGIYYHRRARGNNVRDAVDEML